MPSNYVIMILSFMQNSESTPEHVNFVKLVNPSSLPRTAIAMVIIGLTAGAAGYQLGLRAAKNPFLGNREISLQSSPMPSGELSSSPLIPTRKPSPSPFVFVPKTFYPIPTTDPMLTANWKTYENEKYSFTFRYPPHVYANTLAYPSIMQGKLSDDQLDTIVFQTKQLPRGKSFEELGSLSKEAIDGALRLVFSDKEHEDESFGNSSLVGYKDQGIVIGGKTGRIAGGQFVTFDRDGKYIGLTMRDIDIPLKEKNLS